MPSPDRKPSTKFFLLIFSIPAIILGGYALMWGVSYLLPIVEKTTALYFFIAAAIIALGLSIPYWVLKDFFFAAHEKNPDERTLNLKDIPKDAERIASVHDDSPDTTSSVPEHLEYGKEGQQQDPTSPTEGER